MFFKFTVIVLFCSISLFSMEMDDIYNTLRECQNYSEEDSLQQGIFDWIVSVDNVEECDMKQINFLSSNRNRLTVKGNLALLKSKYEFCNGVQNLGRAFKERESKLLDMKKNCKGHNLNSFKQRLNRHHGEIIELQCDVDELIDDIDK